MPFKGHARKDVVGLHASVPEIFRILAFLCPLRWLLQLYLKPISLFVLRQWWNCVVDWSRRLPTLTICKRSSLMACGLSHITLVTCSKATHLEKKRLVADYLLCKTKPVNLSLLSKVRSLQMRIGKFPFKPELFNIESQIGRSRLELARLS